MLIYKVKEFSSNVSFNVLAEGRVEPSDLSGSFSWLTIACYYIYIYIYIYNYMQTKGEDQEGCSVE